MKRKFDFILNKNKFHQDIFRFYPRLSSVHSFNDAPPKSWDEVYKVYYYWAIIRRHFDDNGKIESESSQILFQMHCDECSRIQELSESIKYVEEDTDDGYITREVERTTFTDMGVLRSYLITEYKMPFDKASGELDYVYWNDMIFSVEQEK